MNPDSGSKEYGQSRSSFEREVSRQLLGLGFMLWKESLSSFQVFRFTQRPNEWDDNCFLSKFLVHRDWVDSGLKKSFG
jgi:hypothetical protein